MKALTKIRPHSKAQYERIFKECGVVKNVTEQAWKYIVQRLREREGRGKTSIVKHRGTQMSEKKIRKQRKVHEFQTALERYATCKLIIQAVIGDP
jgi:hypothetical protein